MDRTKIKFIFITLYLIVGLADNSGASSFDSPRIGIVISKTSYKHRWGVTQMCAHGWAGVVNLAGIPYDCLFISDLTEGKDLSVYDGLILGQCTYVSKTDYPRLIKTLDAYISNGGNLIVDGPLAVYAEDAKERDHTQLDALLNIEYPGFHGNSEFRIQIDKHDHYITRPFEGRQNITQHLVNGLNILKFKDRSEILLVSTDGEKKHPFLSSRETDSGRMILVSDFSTWAGVPSFFRNAEPQVFYANLLYNVLVRAIHWTLYGDCQNPFPVPQVSNADLTAIIRLDADISQNLDAQIQTMTYLTDIAKESGVVSVYGWVSSGAIKAGWQDLAPLGKMMEDAGNQIGTHSQYHHIDQKMNERRWSEELDGSVKDIEFNTADYGYPVGDVDFFINPGNTIRMEDYDQIARRFSFYMTHGFEQDMPIGYGNLTWFTESNKDLVVLENTPSPDYQWFYDPTWSYTTQQITSYEEAIFDHMLNNIGRGVIFNEMWHDYSITSMAQYGKDRIINTNNRPLYDAIRVKFATTDIYCPGPVELGNKLRAMARWKYSWQSSEDHIDLMLDLSSVQNDTISFFTGGMGLAIENTALYIQKVIINGKNHPAFKDRLVLLPNLAKDKNRMMITLGPSPSRSPRLVYISKRLASIHRNGEDIDLSIFAKSKARMAFYADEPHVLLNVDFQEWNRKNDRLLRADITSDRQLKLKKITNRNFKLLYSNIPIRDFREEENKLIFRLTKEDNRAAEIHFYVKEGVKQVLFQGEKTDFKKINGRYEVAIPAFSDFSELVIQLN